MPDMERVKGLRWEIIGNLDGDISFGPDHFEFLTRKVCSGPSPRCGGNSVQGGRLQFG